MVLIAGLATAFFFRQRGSNHWSVYVPGQVCIFKQIGDTFRLCSKKSNWVNTTAEGFERRPDVKWFQCTIGELILILIDLNNI